MDQQPSDATQRIVELESQLEQLWDLVWLLVEADIFQASQARGFNTKVDKLQRVWERHRDLKTKSPP